MQGTIIGRRQCKNDKMKKVVARDSSSRVAPGVSIHAGINPYEFFEKVDRINEMYPYLPDDE